MSKKINKKQKNLSIKDEMTEFLLYTVPEGKIKVEVLLNNETLWLPQKRMAKLFNVGVPAISKHLNNIFETKELDEDSVISILETTAEDGKNYKTKFYSLDAIISVGYRINSSQATQFRIWATQLIKDYIIKGFAMDDERLKNGRYFGKDYFRELLERIRSIRASERRIYLQITDIFAEISTDYNPGSKEAKDFYAMVQNKFHYAITKQTAAEIIKQKADHNAPNMGLNTWKNAPDGRILSSDVTIAKNYLDENQIKRLERTISGFFDYIENIIENRVAMSMSDMAKSVDKFLSFNEYQLLTHKGNVSHKQAKNKALEEYTEFNKTQKINSDFEKVIKSLEKGDKP